ncbi:RIP metalloprotease RseP [Mangrovimonas xylaniphaga]|uniref:RIP metalloprotease RseP n=1 Tax=Mangrovimonas xylaniphaga TaxID=1645915 RepID=UPI0006B5184C|nr:RIP metalloprotease RseP [Mangrovimonas xylaniphaga]
MEFVIKISQFLLSLSLLIVLHELGHFIPAKLFKTRVEKFYLFFDIKFSLFKKKIGETVYGIGWLPLGGYVKIAGMIDESMDTEQMAQEPQPWEFRSKPAWQRLIIMLGGVTVNFILAYVIYVFLSFAFGDIDIDAKSVQDGYVVTNPILTDLGIETGDKVVAINGEPIQYVSEIRRKVISAETLTIERDGQTKVVALPEDFLGKLSDGESKSFFGLRFPFVVGKLPDTSINKGAGLLPKDIITELNGVPLKYYDQIESVAGQFKGQTVTADVLRDGKSIQKQLQISPEGKMEILAGGDLSDIEAAGYYHIIKKEYGFGESFGVGFTKFKDQISGYGEQLKKIFNPKTGAYKGVGGFKAIYDVFPDTWSWQDFWALTAFLSIMLGVLNLLPIPALDGGHVMFLLYEMVSGRAPSEKFLERAQMVGFFILIALVLFANGNDLFKAIFK